MPKSAYPIDPALTAIAIAYRNPNYIADLVLPRIPVGKQEFKFMEYPVDTFFNIAETAVGRKSRPNEIDLIGTEVTDSTIDHGLRGSVPQADIDNADLRYDPLGNMVMLLQEQIALAREKRVAAVVFSAATYPVGLKQTLAGTSQFSDYVNSDPIGVINAALDLPLMRPNQMTFGQQGWTKFKSHPAIVEAVKGTGADKGNVTRQQVAELFELDEIIVGAARSNTANRGQAATLSRLWGKHIALTYKAPVIDAENSVTFGGTFEWGGRFAQQWHDKDIGLRGGTAVQTGESVKERMIATQCGYFIESAFA